MRRWHFSLERVFQQPPIRPLWGRDYELLQVQVDDLYMAADGWKIEKNEDIV